MAAILDLTTSVIEVTHRTLDAIHNAANQDLHLVAHLLGPVKKTKICDLRGRGRCTETGNRVHLGVGNENLDSDFRNFPNLAGYCRNEVEWLYDRVPPQTSLQRGCGSPVVKVSNHGVSELILTSHCSATRGLLATDHVILNHGQVTWTTPELAPPLLTTTPHQREDVSALDRFNVHRCPTRRVFSGTGIELMTCLPWLDRGCGSPVVKVSNHGRHVMSSIPVPLKTRRVGQRCTLNLSRAETSSRWCGVVVRRGGASSGVVHVT
ncbi:uncharacterized protein TNCV_554371 [Trichonephila clavipes]|nr:uncharacterized protein TNCV_554371 [Trichonephila clavipes]